MEAKQLVAHAVASALLLTICVGDIAMASNSVQDSNKALVQSSFDRWRNGTGGPFELLAPEAEWTIVGSSPLSKTYHSRQQFLDEVIDPFNARMATRWCLRFVTSIPTVTPSSSCSTPRRP